MSKQKLLFQGCYDERTDRKIKRREQEKNFNEYVRRYQPFLKKRARFIARTVKTDEKIDAEDILQELLSAAWETASCDKYGKLKDDDKEIASPITYMQAKVFWEIGKIFQKFNRKQVKVGKSVYVEEEFQESKDHEKVNPKQTIIKYEMLSSGLNNNNINQNKMFYYDRSHPGISSSVNGDFQSFYSMWGANPDEEIEDRIHYRMVWDKLLKHVNKMNETPRKKALLGLLDPDKWDDLRKSAEKRRKEIVKRRKDSLNKELEDHKELLECAIEKGDLALKKEAEKEIAKIKKGKRVAFSGSYANLELISSPELSYYADMEQKELKSALEYIKRYMGRENIEI